MIFEFRIEYFTRWPDASTGVASASEQELSKYNSLGQAIWSKDRNANEHSLNYDVLGRETEDVVSMLGVNVDGAVRRQVTEYDGQGNPFQLTSYDATTGGNITSQLSRVYNGLGQMTVEYQSHSGAVVTATTPKVQYAYSFAPAGTTNHSRLTSLTYPNGRVITYDYGTSAGLNDVISRLGEIKDGATSLESYSYLGEGTVVERNHAQPGVNLTYVKLTAETVADGGDQYTGLDRFGRIVDQRWRTSTTEMDRFTYTYDRNSNRLTETNKLSTAYNETYVYDGLDQLTSFNRNAGARTQSFDYDAVGNFEGVTTKVGASPATTQTRTHNRQNEILSVSGSTTPTFDANGNMTTDETGKQYVYDAWNRLTVVKNSSGVVQMSYRYDADNQKIQEIPAAGSTTDLYYNDNWQLLEERIGGTARISYVWSPVYVDAMIARDRDADNNGSLEQRMYATHDANFNVTSIINTAGVVQERYAYDPYGTATILNASFTVIAASTLGWQYLHQGGRLNAASSLYSFRNREYSSTLGRWVNMDPIEYEAGDNNLFRFIENNGVNLLDPSGLAPPNLLDRIRPRVIPITPNQPRPMVPNPVTPPNSNPPSNNQPKPPKPPAPKPNLLDTIKPRIFPVRPQPAPDRPPQVTPIPRPGNPVPEQPKPPVPPSSGDFRGDRNNGIGGGFSIGGPSSGPDAGPKFDFQGQVQPRPGGGVGGNVQPRVEIPFYSGPNGGTIGVYGQGRFPFNGQPQYEGGFYLQIPFGAPRQRPRLFPGLLR